MAEIDIPQTSESEVEKKPNVLKRFITKHPRASKIAAATTAAVVVVGGAVLMNARKDKDDFTDFSNDDTEDLSHLSSDES